MRSNFASMRLTPSTKILISGGSGFIGQALYASLSSCATHILTRQKDREAPFVTDATEPYDIVIQLAGIPLNAKRWNLKTKKEIYASRIASTKKLLSAIATWSRKPKLLICASGAGYYGTHPDQTFSESTEPANKSSFVHKLCEGWEAEACRAETMGIRTCLLRLGVVLGPNDKMLTPLLPLFKWGLGAYMGDGKQWLAWVHLQDVIAIIRFLIAHDELRGAFNLTSPESVTNQIFMRTLAKVLHRPCWLRFPAPLLRLLFGEMADEVLLKGQKVFPQRLHEAGYTFALPKLEDALHNTLTKQGKNL